MDTIPLEGHSKILRKVKKIVTGFWIEGRIFKL